MRTTNLCINLLNKSSTWSMRGFLLSGQRHQAAHTVNTMDTHTHTGRERQREGDRAHPSSQTKAGYAVAGEKEPPTSCAGLGARGMSSVTKVSYHNVSVHCKTADIHTNTRVYKSSISNGRPPLSDEGQSG